MAIVKSAFGYFVALTSILFAFLTFFSAGMIGKAIIEHGNLVVSPNMYGGKSKNMLLRTATESKFMNPYFKDYLDQVKKDLSWSILFLMKWRQYALKKKLISIRMTYSISKYSIILKGTVLKLSLTALMYYLISEGPNGIRAIRFKSA